MNSAVPPRQQSFAAADALTLPYCFKRNRCQIAIGNTFNRLRPFLRDSTVLQQRQIDHRFRHRMP